MAYNNNSFTEDTDAQHSERAHSMANGIGEHGPDLLLTADEIAEMEDYPEEFDTAFSIQIEENADVDAKNVELRAKFEEMKAQYVACQEYIRGEMVLALDQDKEYLNERFDIYGSLPSTRDGVKIMVRAMLTGYDSIDVELPSVPLPPELFETLRDLLTEYTVISEDEIHDEKAEKKAATVFKNVVRRRGERMFSRLRHRAISLWGDDDPRFYEIGLVPKSGIHTPGDPIPGLPDFPRISETFTLSLSRPDEVQIEYSGVNGATHIELYRKLQGEADWKLVIGGLPVDPEEIFPHRDRPGKPGIWEYRITVFNGDVEGESKVATIEVPE